MASAEIDDKMAASIIPIREEYEEMFRNEMVTWECGLIALDMDQEFEDLKEACDLGLYDVAVKLFLSLTMSLCKHFIEDEHWQWFDDFYEPEYVVMRMYHYLDHLRKEGKMPEDGSESLGRSR